MSKPPATTVSTKITTNVNHPKQRNPPQTTTPNIKQQNKQTNNPHSTHKQPTQTTKIRKTKNISKQTKPTQPKTVIA